MKKHINRFGIIALAVMIAFLAAGCEESPLTLLDKEGDNPGTGPVDSPSKGSDLTGAQVDRTNFDSSKPPSVPAAPGNLYAIAQSASIYVGWDSVYVPNATYYVYRVSVSGPFSHIVETYDTTNVNISYQYGNLPAGTYTVSVYARAVNGNGSSNDGPSSSPTTVEVVDLEGTVWVYDDNSSYPEETIYTLSFLANGIFSLEMDYTEDGATWDATVSENGTYTVYGTDVELTIGSDTDYISVTAASTFFILNGETFIKQ